MYCLVVTFTPPEGKDPLVIAAACRQTIIEILADRGITVRHVLVFHNKAKILYSPETEDDIYAATTLRYLESAGLKPIISREAKARRTVLIRGVDPTVYDNIYSYVPEDKLLQGYYDPNSGLMKLAFCDSKDAIKVAKEGFKAGVFEYPPSVCSLEEYIRINECFSCYEPNPDHSFDTCTYKGISLCSTCGRDTHRYTNCPGTEAPLCLVCMRRGLAAEHSTRTQACPIRKQAISEARIQFRARARSRSRATQKDTQTYPPQPTHANTPWSTASNVIARNQQAESVQPAVQQTHIMLPPQQTLGDFPALKPPKPMLQRPPRPAPRRKLPQTAMPPTPTPTTPATPATPAQDAAPASHATSDTPYNTHVSMTQEEKAVQHSMQQADPLGYASRVANAALTYGCRAEIAVPGSFDKAVHATFVVNNEIPLKFPNMVDPREMLRGICSTHGNEYMPYRPTKPKKKKNKKAKSQNQTQSQTQNGTPTHLDTAASAAQQQQQQPQQKQQEPLTPRQVQLAAGKQQQQELEKLKNELKDAKAELELYKKKVFTMKTLNLQPPKPSPEQRPSLSSLMSPRHPAPIVQPNKKLAKPAIKKLNLRRSKSNESINDVTVTFVSTRPKRRASRSPSRSPARLSSNPLTCTQATNVRSPSPAVASRTPSPAAASRTPSSAAASRTPSPAARTRTPSPAARTRTPSPVAHTPTRSPSPTGMRHSLSLSLSPADGTRGPTGVRDASALPSHAGGTRGPSLARDAPGPSLPSPSFLSFSSTPASPTQTQLTQLTSSTANMPCSLTPASPIQADSPIFSPASTPSPTPKLPPSTSPSLDFALTLSSPTRKSSKKSSLSRSSRHSRAFSQPPPYQRPTSPSASRTPSPSPSRLHLIAAELASSTTTPVPTISLISPPASRTRGRSRARNEKRGRLKSLTPPRKQESENFGILNKETCTQLRASQENLLIEACIADLIETTVAEIAEHQVNGNNIQS